MLISQVVTRVVDDRVITLIKQRAYITRESDTQDDACRFPIHNTHRDNLQSHLLSPFTSLAHGAHLRNKRATH